MLVYKLTKNKFISDVQILRNCIKNKSMNKVKIENVSFVNAALFYSLKHKKPFCNVLDIARKYNILKNL